MSATMAVSDHFVLCKAALIFAVTKWRLFSFFLNLLNSISFFSSSSTQTSSKRNSSSLANLKDGLTSTTFGNIQHRQPQNGDTSCAVCLYQLKKKSQVFEIRKCCHVFHKHCLERWLAYDGSRLTCPLCRASLQPAPPPETPHWAVERMLYLFGDDLLP